jgi:ribosomal protein S18 acetylase RimI-like enzyme
MTQSATPPWFLLRKNLADPLVPPLLPPGIALATLDKVPPIALHALLVSAYANGGGSVADFDAWWTHLVEDVEFDPALVFVAVDEANGPVALCQCWSSGFIKDLVTAPTHRGQGLGEALLRTAFAAFKARGIALVDLKVQTQNADAQRLYTRVGMVKAPL